MKSTPESKKSRNLEYVPSVQLDTTLVYTVEYRPRDQFATRTPRWETVRNTARVTKGDTGIINLNQVTQKLHCNFTFWGRPDL